MGSIHDQDAIDLNHLLKLRLVVARYGEMDIAKWWNTKGMLGKYGKTVLSRGFPRTHYLAQARVVFAVAKSRCEEVFNPPGCMTLWALPAEIEDQFEEEWHTWLDESDRWGPLYEKLADMSDGDLLAQMHELKIMIPAQIEKARSLHRTAEGRAVPIPGVHQPSNEILTILAAGFSRGQKGQLAVPYARLEE